MAKVNRRIKNLTLKMVQSSLNKDGSINSLKVRSFVKSLKKLSLTDSIQALTEYSKGLKRQLSKTTLTIESSIKLTTDEQKKITKVTSLHTPYTILHTTHNLSPSLLGGFRIKIGDTLIDNSISGKVAQLKERITNF